MSSVADRTLALPRPYKWGKFQGWFSALIGTGMIFGGLWLHNVIGIGFFLVGLFGLFEGIGLITRKKYGVVLLDLYFIFVLLEQFLPHPNALFPVMHIFELLFWGIPVAFYYPKRWREFR
jgi:hypothetical protein